MTLQLIAGVPKVFVALSLAFSGVGPVYAGIPGSRVAPRDFTLPHLLKVQSVDPGDPDPDDNDDGGDTDGGNDGGNTDGNSHDGRGTRSDNRGGERQDYLILSEKYDTNQIIQDLRFIRGECRRYDEVYRIDCLRQGIDMTIARMSDRPENRDVKRILRRASRQLASIVSTYEDRAAPKLEVPRNVNPRFKTRRTYRAIKRSALPRAMAKARVVVNEAATQLLRSAENSERRYAHFQQISAAVDSTKVLLRSG